MLPGPPTLFKSIDRSSEKEDAFGTDLPTTVFNKQLPSGMPPHELQLKPGCVVICLRNLNVNAGVCNGTRLRVDQIKEEVCRTLKNTATGDLLHAAHDSTRGDQIHLHEVGAGTGRQGRRPVARLHPHAVPATSRILLDRQQGTRANPQEGFFLNFEYSLLLLLRSASCSTPRCSPTDNSTSP